MLVDLGRNDLSRVCLPGTVQVERFLEAERFSHITHLVSEVVGELAPGVSSFDLLRATLPGRNRVGRPEGARDADHLGARAVPPRPVRRRGRSTRSPAARSTPASRFEPFVLHDGVALLQAGAGIVADSDPRAEHEECLRKLAALETGDRSRRGASLRDPARRQLRLVHLQPRAPVRRAGRRGRSCTATTRSPRTKQRRLQPSHLVISPGPGRPEDAGATAGDPATALANACRRSASASATRRSCRCYGGEVG